ncbi:DoxX family protein [Arenibaculum pallidiluteum]|uniref:DoxX family protein n=1 Tax=Arenibaculum pallidiluteum TaxID=2812559 RepID=UPI001A971BFF|nr:DoxX family protein [Arenibaculum pallidiluteum]
MVIPALGGFYARLAPVTYAFLRFAFGVTMLTHGLPKILGTSHGSMADPMAGSMNLISGTLGLPFAPQLAVMVAILETFGGIALALGFLTRLIAPMMAVQMAFISIALGPTWPWIDRGIEYPVMLGFLALFISFQGGGPFSLDHAVGREL